MTYDVQSFSTRRRVNSLAVDRIDEQDFQRVKLVVGDEGEALAVSDDNPIPVAIISGGGGGDGSGVSEVDDSAFTAGTDSGTPIMGFATADSVDSGDVGVVAMTTSRALHVQVQNSSIPVTDNGGSLTVDGTVAVSGTVPVTDNGGSLTVDGTVTVDDGGGSITVDGTVGVSGTVTVTGTGGTFPVTDSGGSLTVDGTVAATQSGTWNIGSITTLPSIPSGTNNIGDVDVLSIVPGTGATSLGKAEDAAHASGDTGVMSLAVRRDADTSLVGTDGDYAPLQVNSTGSLKVAITSGVGSGGTSIADGASFTRDTTSVTPAGAVVESSAPTLTNGDVAGLSQDTSGNLRVRVAAGGIAGVVEDAAASDGVEGVAVMAVRRDSASSGVSADGDYAMLSVTSDGSLRVSGGGGGTQYAEDVAHVSGDTGTLALAVRRDTAAVGSGTDGDYSTLNVDSSGRLHVNVGNTVNVASHAVTNAGTFAVQVSSIAAGTNNIGDVDVLTLPALAAGTNTIGNVINAASATVGGHTPFKSLDLDETEEEVKGSAGKLFWIHCMNMAATVRYLKVYNNTAAGTTVGTTTPVLTFPIPTLATTNGAGFAIHFGDTGITLGTGITVAATTGLADNDTGAPGANEVVVNLGYL